MRKTLVALALLTTVASPASALVVSLDSVTTVGANRQFNYSVALASDEQFQTGSVFAIFDFAGYVAGSITGPAGFVATTEASSGLAGLGATDDPATLNLVFRPTGTLSGFEFSGFSALTSLTGTTNDGFSSITTKINTAGTPTLVGSQGIVGVPLAVTPIIPEPATWGMMLAGFGLVGVASRRRRRTMHVLG